jgi:hypothetical protein
MAPRKPSSNPSPSNKPSTPGESGKSAELNRINGEIEQIEVQIAQVRLEDKQAELTHKQAINGKKQEIRTVTEQTWDRRVEVVGAGLKVAESKVESANDKVSQESELTSLNRTLGEERVAKVRRKIYAVHEFEDVLEN